MKSMWRLYPFLLTINLFAHAGGQSTSLGSGPAATTKMAFPINAVGQKRATYDAPSSSLPRQLGARGKGDAATGDDCEKLDDAIRYAAQAGGATQKTVHLAGGNWRCRDAHYLILLPRDMGDYLNEFSGRGAQFSLNIVQGRIISCDISGGIGYNPGSYIIGQVTDYSHTGSGGAVHARADANGVPLPGSCIVEQPGINYQSMRDVNVLSFAQGADGASAKVTLVAGRVSSAQIVPNASSMPNGNGYTSIPDTQFPAGLECETMPIVRLALGKVGLSDTAIKGITSTPGSKCTFDGSDTGTVPVFIGGSDPGRTKQAVNIAPEPANVLPCAIQLRPGITVDGDGALIEPDWATGAYNLTASKVIFCDAYGDQVTNSGLRNLTLSAMVGVWLSGSTSNFVMENVSGIYSSDSSGNTFAIRKGTGGGLLFYAAQTGPATYIRNINIQSPGAIVIGGQWTSRAGTSGLGSMGGYDLSRGTAARGGNYTSLVVDGINQVPAAHPPSPPTNSHSAQLDAFFETYVWKTQNSPTDNVNAPNGTGACLSTQPILVRQVDTRGDASGTGPYFYQCYRGVSDMLFVGVPRVSNLSTAVDIRHLAQGGGYRPAVLAAIDQSRIEELSFVLGKPYIDPYVPSKIAKSLGYVEIPGIGIAPSIIIQNLSLPVSPSGFLSQYSITQGATSSTANACVWGISGISNRC